MSKFIFLIIYLTSLSFFTRLAVIWGWGHDPGYTGPSVLIFLATFVLAVRNEV